MSGSTKSVNPAQHGRSAYLVSLTRGERRHSRPAARQLYNDPCRKKVVIIFMITIQSSMCTVYKANSYLARRRNMTPHRAARNEAQCSRINRRGESESKIVQDLKAFLERRN